MTLDGSLSDAAFAALSRAAALARHRPGPWPPVDVSPLDRNDLARELHLLRDLDRGHELAAVALADQGDAADPTLRAELARLAGPADPEDMSEKPGSVGAALRARALDGLTVRHGGRALRIDWLRPHGACGDERLLLAVRWQTGDATLRARGQTRPPSALARGRTLAPDWRARAEAALRAALLGDDDHPDDLAAALVQALLPGDLAGRAAWLLTRGAALLGVGAARPLVEVTRDGVTHSLSLTAATHDGLAASYGLVRLTARVVVAQAGQVVDITEREVFADPLSPADYDAPAPTDEATAQAAIDAWRAAARDYFTRDDVRVDPDFLSLEFLAVARPLSLLAAWLEAGPPGPAPAAPPRAALDDARLAAAAARARLLDEGEVDALRATVDDQLLAALELDGWLAMFCPCHRPAPGTFQEDRIRLRPPGGEALPILMSDPWNGHVMPIDGDAALFRVVARFWRELLERRGLDVAFTRPRDADADTDEYEGDEYDESADDGATSLRAWLEFPLPDPTPPFPPIDWRVYEADARDFVADFTFWGGGPFAMSPELRARYEAAIATHYHAYVRALIDPDLRPR